MKRHTSIHLRWWLPIIMLSALAVMMAASSVWRYEYQTAKLEQQTNGLIKERLARLQHRIEVFLRLNQDALVAEEIADFGNNLDVNSLALIDEQGRVLHAAQRIWLGKAITEVMPDFDSRRFIELQQHPLLAINFDTQRNRLIAYQPLVLAASPGEIRPSRVGMLLLDYSLVSAKAEIRQELWNQAIGNLIISALVMLLLVLALYHWVSHPLSEANLRAMLDNSPYLVWLKDPDGRFIKVNQVFADYFKLSDTHQAEGMTDFDLNPKELAEKYRADDIEVMRSRKQKHLEETTFDGKNTHKVETYKTPIIDAYGNVLGTVGFANSITERKKAEAELQIAATAFESQDSLMITDADGVILRVNRAFTESTGYTSEEIVGQTPRILKSGRHNADFYSAMWETVVHTGKWQGEIWDRRKNGEIYPKWLSISAVTGTDGVVTHYVGSHTDITERKASEEKIRHLAFYDHLTGLPNRMLLLDRLKQALISSARNGRAGALLFMDLDKFKDLNDTLGHDIGDMLLKQVTQRLKSCVREGDTVARLGGDEFVVMLVNLSAQSMEAATQIESIGEKILAALSQPYQLDNHAFRCTASIGATLFNGDQHATDDLMKQADIAMYQAKKAGRNALRFFGRQMQESISARVSLEGELLKALEFQQLHLHYQIQVDSSSHPVGAEALIRWIHPVRGLVSPAQFIPLAEETGLILSIGQWVLETACAQLKSWQQAALTRDLVLAVNVSAKQFRQSDFVAQVKATIQRYVINPMRLKLELTESLLLDDIEGTIATMNALKEIGVQFSLDDFGTGYSSLQYLKRLPLDQIKIDQSFVRDIAADKSDRDIICTIIAMAHSFNLNVIAEGVETEGQREFLLRNGCIHYQGYLFSKPVQIDQFEALLVGRVE